MKIPPDTQDKMIRALADAAFIAEDAGEIDKAEALRFGASQLAKHWKISEVHGLPLTWKRGKRVPDYT